MMKYLINYDLCKPEKNYDDLLSAITGFRYHAFICESCWAVKSDLTLHQIKDQLIQYMDADDKLFVCVFGEYVESALPKDTRDWLNTY